MMKKAIAVLVATVMISTFVVTRRKDIAAVTGPTPDIIGKNMPLGMFLEPTFLYFDGPRLYIVEQGMRRVQGIYPKSEFAFGTFGQHNGQLYLPAGITSYKGTTFLCDNVNNKILMHDKEGRYTGEFKVYNNQQQLLNQPRGVAQYQGRLYIANPGSSSVIVCDTNGKYIDTINYNQDGTTFVEPTGVGISSDKIIVTDPGLKKIIVFDLSGKVLTSIPLEGCWAVTGTDSKFYVTSQTENKVYIYNTSDYSLITTFGESGSRPGQLSRPMGVGILEDKIHVSSYDNNRIDIFDQSGKHLGVFGLDAKDALGSFGSPMGMAINGDKLIVADKSRHKVVIYNRTNGAFDSEFGQFGTGDKDLNSPSGVAADDSSIYVADTGNNCVKVFAYDGAYKKTIGSYGQGLGKLSIPSDVAVIPSLGKLFVSDTGNNLIQEFSLSGEFTRQFGGFGSVPGKFNNPLGIATDGSKLIVADSANCRVQELQLDGNFVRSYGEKGRGPDKLFFPSDCVVDASGKVYISDTYNHRLSIFDPKTEFFYDFGQNGGPSNINFMTPAVCPEEKRDPKAFGWFNFPQGIAIDEYGCFVSDTFNHRIQYVEYGQIFNTNPFLVSPLIVDFGVVGNGQDATQRIQIKNLSGGEISGIVEIPASANSWLKTHGTSFTGDESPIELYVDAEAEPNTYSTTVTIITNKDVGDNHTQITVKAVIGESFGYTIDADAFINAESTDRFDIPVKILAQNNYTGNVALDIVQVPPGTYGQFSVRMVNLAKQNDSVLTIKASKTLGRGIYRIRVKAQSLQINVTVERDICIIVSRSRTFDNKTVLMETFTAKWCINCPYAHRAAERLLEEYGDTKVIPVMYYVEAKDDDVEPFLYYHPADNRYKTMGSFGLPTTFFNGQNSTVGGDNDEERKKAPKDKQPCDRFTGTTFTYLRYKQEVEKGLSELSPLKMFIEANVKDGYIDANINIETLQQIDSKNLFLYVVLTEDNIFDPGVNGDEYHNLVVREMYTTEKGEPINLVTGTTFKKSMHLKLPTYVDENNSRFIVWIQRNTSKETIQTQAIKLNFQGIKDSILVKTESPAVSIEIDKESSVDYHLTNAGSYTEKVTINPTLSVEGWDWSLYEGNKELPKKDIQVTLEPMQSMTVTAKIKPPSNAKPGTNAQLSLNVGTGRVKKVENTVSLVSIPKLPPDFKMNVSVSRIDLSRRTTSTLTIPIQQINGFDGVVTLTNCTQNPSIGVDISPITGIPPFDVTITVTGGQELTLGDHRICLLATGITSAGETVEHKTEIPVNVLYANIVLGANPKKVVSCSENQSCHSTNVEIAVNSPVEISECKFSVRYDPTVLTTSHRAIGSFLGPNATMDFIDRASEGLITVHIKGKLSKGDGLLCSIMMRGVKGVSKAGSQIEVCDVSMYNDKGQPVLTNIGCTASKVDIISQIAPPILTCDVKDGAVFDQEYYTITGSCKSTDPDYHTNLTVNGRPVIVKSDWTWEYVAKLREGINQFVIIAKDETGGSTGLKFTIVRDSTPPQIGITNIKDNGHTRNPFFNLEGWVDEKVDLTINDEPVEINQFKEFSKPLKLVKGPNKITLRATDQLGKVTELVITIWLDSKTVLNLWLNQTKYTIDGKVMTLSAAPTSSSPPLPKALAGNTFMPIREVTEALGATIAWDATDKKVTIIQNLEDKTKTIELWINKKTARINEAEVRIDEKGKLYPVIVAGKTLLPLRFVATALGASVEYVAKEKKIVLTYPVDMN